MEIRSATEQDIPAIVALLKVCLGDGRMPKSESFWRWKHVTNPFGPSPVLLAAEGRDIIGVRAFMQWEWMFEGVGRKAVRAVDTAVHPNHQGKGIFTKLTLALVVERRKSGTDFIFNTPNAASRPGYLKMGWQDVGRMQLRVSPVLRASANTTVNERYNPTPLLQSGGLHELLSESLPLRSGQMMTRYSPEYLRWRYLDNPNIPYLVVGNISGSSSFLFICRIKEGFFRELRVCDAFAGPKAARKTMKESLSTLAQDMGAHVITFAGPRVAFPVFNVRVAAGPRVTVLKLQGNVDDRLLLDFTNWIPSLGDMELF